MNKAFDGSNLLKRVLAKVLPVVAPAVGEVVDWTAESLEMSPSPYQKLLGGVVRSVKAPISDEITKAINSWNSEVPAVQA